VRAVWPICVLSLIVSCHDAPKKVPYSIPKDLAEDLAVLDELTEIVLADRFPKQKNDWSRYGKEHRHRNVAH